MKNIYKYLLIILMQPVFFGCEDLNLVPKTAISTDNFFNNAQELEIALNALYEKNLWRIDEDFWTDDSHHRGAAGVNNEINRATINSESGIPGGYWRDLYEGIKRANVLLDNMESSRENILPETFDRIEGEARVIRAYFYITLISKFSDVPLLQTASISIDEALSMARTSVPNLKQFVYSELDEATALLPNSNANRVTQGFAQGIKARFALYVGDFDIARDASKYVIDLGTYSLHPEFQSLFNRSSAESPELIYFIPESFEIGITIGNTATRDLISRLAGGFGARFPTWSAVHIFECTDGLPIDESPLYNPHDPFNNRDPRMVKTIVEFGTPHLGFIYQPHPDSVTTLNINAGTKIGNNDSRGVASFASFTGFLWKKGIEQSWADTRDADPNIIILRYADILLMYAESLIELNEDLNLAQDAINQVRARAYGTTVGDLANYPEVSELSQAGLRIRLRRERRVEMMREGLRYQDLIRWGIAKKALDRILLGIPNSTDLDRNQWPFTDALLPNVDEDGVVIFDANTLLTNNWARLLQDYDFDESKQYLWPVPASDRMLNSNLTQNPNY